MRILFRHLACAVFALLGLTARLPAEADPDGVSVQLEQVVPSPCPFQPVRLRMTLKNTSKKRIGPIIRPERVARDPEIKGPGDDEYRQLKMAILLYDWRHQAAFAYGLNANWDNDLFLEPGEQTSLAVAYAADWTGDPASPKSPLKGAPLFPKPGKYSIRCECFLGVKKNDQGEKEDVTLHPTAEVEVQEPEGDDKDVYDFLQADDELASALMNPLDPPEKELLPKLQNLVKRHAKSSYAVYARFALARYEAGRVTGPDYRVHAALAATELDKVVDERFAYQPYARMLMRECDPVGREGMTNALDRDSPDALEWLKDRAKHMKLEDWEAFRKRVPPADKDQP